MIDETPVAAVVEELGPVGPLIDDAAVRIVGDVVVAAEVKGALDRAKGWARHIVTLLPTEEELRALEAQASLTLQGFPDARLALSRRLAGLAQRFKVPRSPLPREPLVSDPQRHDDYDQNHDHDGATIDIRTAITLRLASSVASHRGDAPARRNDLALESLFARVSMVATLVPLATRALVDRAELGRFVTALEEFEGGPLGPGGSSFIVPERPVIDPRILICIERAHIAIQHATIAFPTLGYHLQTMNRPRACPGERVVFTGVRFGAQAGKVIFRGTSSPGALAPAVVDPANWSDTRIEVDIPANAGAGPVSLALPRNIPKIPLCGHSFYVPPIVQSDVFYEAGGGAVDELRVRRGSAYPLLAGSPVTIEWATRPGDAYVVLWITDPTGTLLVDATGLTSTGTYTWTPPAGVATTYRATLYAYHCGIWKERDLDLDIEVSHQIGVRAIEVTQVVQFLGAQALAGGGGDTNSIPMVRGKTTMVRIYLESNQASALESDEPYVDLYGFDQHGNPLPQSPLTASARRILPATTSLGDVAGLDDDLRDQIDASVNFVLPWSWLAQDPPLGRNWATLRLEAQVGTFGTDIEIDTAKASETTTVRIYSCAPLRVIMVRIALGNQGLSLPPPTSAVARATLDQARHMLPSARLEVVDDFEHAFRWLAPPVLGEAEFDDIYFLLQDLASKRDDDADVIYCGILPATTQVGRASGAGDPSEHARGCAVFRANHVETAAHELGHACGRPHTWDTSDANDVFPDYDDGVSHTAGGVTSDLNGLGQWGLAAERSYYDHGDAAPVFRPSTTTTVPASGHRQAGDLMSYRHHLLHGRWPSPYTYQRLLVEFGGIGVTAVGVPTVLSMAGVNEPRRSIAIVSGTIAAGMGVVAVTAHHKNAWPHVGLRSRSLNGQEMRRTLLGDTTDPPLWIAALDDADRALTNAVIEPRLDGERGLRFIVAIDLPDAARRLSLRSGSRELWTARRGEPPAIEHVSVDRDGERVIVRWRAPQAKTCAVALSFDAGRTWRQRTPWIAETAWSATLAEIGRGGAVAFRVLAHDGEFATSYRDTPLELPPRKGRIVAAFGCDDERTTWPAEHRVRLSAMALASDDTSRDDAAHAQLQWTSDRQGELGTGRVIDAVFSPGEHTVTVADEDSDPLVFRVLARAD